MNNDDDYSALELEAAVQQFWQDQGSFDALEDPEREKFYCLSMLPYPSGELHMGHLRNYTIGDVIARYQMMQGKRVLQPMGWDAFGLPAENAAIERQRPPSDWTRNNILKMRAQFKQLGYAFDWKRELATCDPAYYRWEQWLFIQLYKKGLVYRKSASVNWDPVDQTVLANEQVVNGRGWRSGAWVEQREIPQWFLRITDYAEELLDGLDQLTGWPSAVLHMQRHWIGRSNGLEIQFEIMGQSNPVTVFTTRADTLMGVTYLALAPTHPLAKEVAQCNPEVAEFIQHCQQSTLAEAQVATREKEGIDTQQVAIHPITAEKLPVWISNFVLMEYGSGVVMAVPAHDERDFEFAKQYHLPIRPVVIPPKDQAWDFDKAAYTGMGLLIDSHPYDGLPSEQAIQAIGQALVEQGKGRFVTHYRLRDWGISRQRYWGTPIPMIHCPSCGPVPVPEEQLPVLLPTNMIPDGHSSPLATASSFYSTNCPQCKRAAKRETDTMDTFVESSWYYARYCSYDQQEAMLDDRVQYWTPVDQYIGGVEHAVMHLLYARFMHKLLRDQGLVHSDEPFSRLLTQGMVLKDGAKMSKSKGNVVSLQSFVERYGADTLRLFIIFAAPPEQTLEWSDSGVEGARRFLNKLWKFAMQQQAVLQRCPRDQSLPERLHFEDPVWNRAYQDWHRILQQADQDMQRLQLNTVVSAGMKLLNCLIPLKPQRLLEYLLYRDGLSGLLRVLAPITPHITQALWQRLGFGEDILKAPWPKANEQALQAGQIEWVVQVNGKRRDQMTLPADSKDEQVEQQALQCERIQAYIKGQRIKKVIIVPRRLVNVVI